MFYLVNTLKVHCVLNSNIKIITPVPMELILYSSFLQR